MVNRVILMDDSIRSTVQYIGNTSNMSTYQEIYTLNFEFVNVIGVFINGTLNIANIEVDDLNRLVINGIKTYDNDKIYIFVKQEIDEQWLFSKIDLPKPFTPYVVGNQTTITFLNTAAEQMSKVKELIGIVINGVFYGNDRVTLDTETNQITITDFIIEESHIIGLYVNIEN